MAIQKAFRNEPVKNKHSSILLIAHTLLQSLEFSCNLKGAALSVNLPASCPFSLSGGILNDVLISSITNLNALDT